MTAVCLSKYLSTYSVC